MHRDIVIWPQALGAVRVYSVAIVAAGEVMSAHWYTVYGTAQDGGGATHAVGALMAALGAAGFILVLRRDL